VIIQFSIVVVIMLGYVGSSMLYFNYFLDVILTFALPVHGLRVCLETFVDLAKNKMNNICYSLDPDCSPPNYFSMVLYKPGPGLIPGLIGSPGLGINLLFLFLSGCLHILILYLLEHKALVKVSKTPAGDGGSVFQPPGEVTTGVETTQAYQLQG